MYKQTFFYQFFSILMFSSVLLSFSGCGLLSGFQDGRALGKKNGEVLMSINSTRSNVDRYSSSENKKYFGFEGRPTYEFGAKYGITNRLDVSFRLNSSITWAAGLKYQFAGDRMSKFAMGIGFDYNRIFEGYNGYNSFQVPLYTSIHPSEKTIFYFSPRYYMLLNQSNEYGLKPTSLGFNTGFLYGKKFKIGFDLGYAFKNISYGLGVKWLLGKN